MGSTTPPDNDKTSEDGASGGYLEGQYLIAMPNMQDPRFAKALVYICVHNEEGALGLVVNKPSESIDFADLLEQLDIDPPEDDQTTGETGGHYRNNLVLSGGPVEAGRGFVLHSNEYDSDSTMPVSKDVSLTTSVDIVRDIAFEKGPDHYLIALGYAGWAPGQLDAEIQANGWLNVASGTELLFSDKLDEKWSQAIAELGIDASQLAMLSSDAGRA